MTFSLARAGFDGGEIRHDESGDEAALVADQRGVLNVGAGLQGVFNRRGRDELAAGGLQQLFLAIGDDQVAVFIEIADVAGGKPAVGRNGFASLVGLLVVTHHDARAADEDFAVIGDAHLDVLQGMADGADVVRRRRCCC